MASDVKEKSEEAQPDHPWKQVQTAVWLIGLAILAWQDWWWPGILVLVAISGLTEAAMRQISIRQEENAGVRQQEADAAKMREALTPSVCPNCGSPVVPSDRRCGSGRILRRDGRRRGPDDRDQTA